MQSAYAGKTFRLALALEDPSGKRDDAFLKTIQLIEEKVLNLRERMK